MELTKESPIVGAIDIGSNSIKLLLAHAKNDPAEQLEIVLSETIETRISQGISKDQLLFSPQIQDTAIASIQKLIRLANEHKCEQLRIVATSAVRDASNRTEFARAIFDKTGYPLRILSGTQEATLIAKGLRLDPQLPEVSDWTQMDIGGGSLELVRSIDGNIQQACSLNLGAVRLSEKFIVNPEAHISPKQANQISEHVTDSLKNSGFKFDAELSPLISTGGAFHIASQIGQQHHAFDFQSGDRLSTAFIAQIKAWLMQQTLRERKMIAGLPPSRADILPTALITIEALLRYTGYTYFQHSYYNLRYGLIGSMLFHQA